MPETNRIAYKRELHAGVDIENEVIAFLNYYEGGVIYIGIDNVGKVVGVADADRDALKIKDRIKNNISPSAMGLFDVVVEVGEIGKIRSNRQDLTFEQLRIYYEEKRKPLNNQFKKSLELLTGDCVPPKFDIFADSIEITSAGTLPEGMSEEDFFDGVSIPRNRELMRVYRDLELVEQLGSGVPRILESYGKECFRFMGNFIRMTFPASAVVTEQVTEQVLKLLSVADRNGRTSAELMALVGIKHRPTFLYNYLQPALDLRLMEMTIPDKPKSSKQRYVLTELGKRMQN